MLIEKRPGYDWLVTYEIDDEVQTMMIFGVMTIEEAVRDARSSFVFDHPAILKAERQ